MDASRIMARLRAKLEKKPELEATIARFQRPEIRDAFTAILKNMMERGDLLLQDYVVVRRVPRELDPLVWGDLITATVAEIQAFEAMVETKVTFGMEVAEK